MNYHEREQYIYDQLTADIENTGLYFSMRKNGNKNARRDIFIGTEKSNYFKFSFWNVPVGFAGSSGNLMDFSIFHKSDSEWTFRFETAIPKSVTGDQNKLSLQFLIYLADKLKSDFKDYKHSYAQEHNRIFFTNIDRQESFSDFKILADELLGFINKIAPFIDKHISDFQITNPGWKASRYVQKEFQAMNASFERRLKKYPLEQIKKEEEVEEKEVVLMDNIKPDLPNNQILYGPPGTGKTYRSISLALDILGVDTKQERSRLVEIYENFRKKGRIAFTTFHQSMSYVDFVEGIKPSLDDEDDDISYEIKDGILKSSAKMAIQEFVKWGDNKSLSFEDRYDQLIEQINNTENGFELNSKTGSKLILEEVTAKNNIQVAHENGNRKYIVSKVRMEKVYHGLLNETAEITNINKAIRNIIGGSNATAYWTVNEHLKSMQGEKASFEFNNNLTDVQYENIIRSVDWSEASSLDVEKYVLIIDEINRGNVSGVFGELITLLEDDKRLDKENRIVLKLPYSKFDFGIPSNLYIIGTMNTADRSVEALDTALRRRFSFKEVMPDPKVISKQSEEKGSDDIDGMDLVEILETINKRIEILLSRDHTIGHSYFLGLNDIEGLRDTFKNKIIPLLQEYFYNDFEKIELVIGSGFIQKTRIENTSSLFAGNSSDIDIPDYKYQFTTINNDFDITAAINLLLNKEEITSDEL